MEEVHRVDLARWRPSPTLGGVVAGMVGMSERAPGVVRRRQPAGTLIPLVISFGDPLTVQSLADATGAGRAYGCFVAGMSAGWADTWFKQRQDCIQVYLTPVGVRRILGVPGREVAHRVLPLDDVVPAVGEVLAEQLHSASSWRERFGCVERTLLRQAAREEDPPSWVVGLWRDIQQRGGQVRVRDLVADTGWSHRHVASVFGEAIGLTPKQAANLVRFERATSELGRWPLAEVAARHGYVDQSHLTRHVARYAGETPTELLAARRPTPVMALGCGGWDAPA